MYEYHCENELWGDSEWDWEISAIMIASISVGMSFNESPCESVIRSLIMSLSAESN